MTHTVMVVEDELELRETMRDALELNGYNVVTAADGDEALKKLSDIEHLCLVILDLLMPVMNGWDFLANMRQRSELTGVPVVVHSSATTQPPEGATLVLQKPMVFETLLSVVQQYCRQ